MGFYQGCSHNCKIEENKPKIIEFEKVLIENKAIPLRIGLLADSQITTVNGVNNYSIYRSKVIDNFIDVSIRPPASDYLSKNMLRYFLRELISTNPDVILYLGNGANNGCSDEINEVFSILNEYRNTIPIFL